MSWTRAIRLYSCCIFFVSFSAAQTSTSTPPPAKFLYVDSNFELGINSSTGALTYLRTITPGVGIIDPTYRFTYYVDYPEGQASIEAYHLNQTTGAETPVTGSPFSSGYPYVDGAVYPDHIGHFLFFTGQDASSDLYLVVFQINQNTGALTQTDRVLVTDQPTTWNWSVTNSTDKFVYVGYDSSPNGIVGYTLDTTTGTLTEIAGSPFSAGPVLRMGTAGHFLYASNSDDTLSGFSIDAQTGSLTQVAGSPFQNSLQNGMAIDPVHAFLFTTNSDANCTQGTNAITTFRINSSTGVLSKIATSGGSVLNCPASIAADPSGKFVYVGDLKMEPSCEFDQCVGATSSFSLNSTTGGLTVVTRELPYPGDPYDNNFPIAPER